MRISITLGSIIPPQTGRSIPGIPATAGLARRVYSPKRVREPTVGLTIVKVSKPSWTFKVEKDEALEEEIRNNKECKHS